MIYGKHRDIVADALRDVKPEQLAEALATIYAIVFCDENGSFNPEESVAADCCGDAIQSIGVEFQDLSSLMEKSQ